MVKVRNSGKNNSNSSGNNSFLASSLMRMFSFNQVNVCSSDDQSFYCKFMRFFQFVISVIILVAIVYVIYILGKGFFMKKGGIKLG